jgi:hypothetical protein
MIFICVFSKNLMTFFFFHGSMMNLLYAQVTYAATAAATATATATAPVGAAAAGDAAIVAADGATTATAASFWRGMGLTIVMMVWIKP